MTSDTHLRWAACLGHELDPRINEAVRLNFVSERFDLATFAAMRQVEIRLRELADAPDSDVGVALARRALHPDTGVLTDQTADRGEREALGHLFAGALGFFKNPSSHRQIDLADPTEAAEIILLSDLLLRLLDRREAERP
jgi:uncharacterized protein (TIGR02391 family)